MNGFASCIRHLRHNQSTLDTQHKSKSRERKNNVCSMMIVNFMRESVHLFHIYDLRWHCWISCQSIKTPHVCRCRSHHSANWTSSTWIMPKRWGMGRMAVTLPMACAFCPFYSCTMCKCWWWPLVHWTRHSRVTETLNLIPMGCQMAANASRIRMCRTTWSRTAWSSPIGDRHRYAIINAIRWIIILINWN